MTKYFGRKKNTLSTNILLICSVLTYLGLAYIGLGLGGQHVLIILIQNIIWLTLHWLQNILVAVSCIKTYCNQETGLSIHRLKWSVKLIKNLVVLPQRSLTVLGHHNLFFLFMYRTFLFFLAADSLLTSYRSTMSDTIGFWIMLVAEL